MGQWWRPRGETGRGRGAVVVAKGVLLLNEESFEKGDRVQARLRTHARTRSRSHAHAPPAPGRPAPIATASRPDPFPSAPLHTRTR